MSVAATARQDVQHYLALLYPDVPADAWLVVSWRVDGGLHSHWVPVADRDTATTLIADHAAQSDVYLGVGLRYAACVPSPDTRGTNADVCALAGLHVDLDHTGGVHSSPHLPTPDALLAFMHRQPFDWSLVIDSGGGVQGFLLFKEPWLLETPEEQANAAALLKRFQRTLQLQASTEGWTIDSTADLARILRPAGTFNHKTAPPRQVTILHEDGARYNPSSLAEMPWMVTIDETFTPQPTGHNGAFPPTDLALVQHGCAWMQHCYDDAATLTEPEWYSMLGIVGRCTDGDTAAHEWSLAYPRYTRQETTRKLRQALKAAGPRTCGGIRYDLDADPYCRECVHWGTLKSPIVLGMPPQADPLTGTPGRGLGWPGGQNGTAEHAAATTTHATAAQRPQTDFDRTRETQWFKDKVEKYANKKWIIEANDTTINAFLRNHPDWQGRLWWNDMANRPMVGDAPLDDYLLTDIGDHFGDKHNLPIRHASTKLAKCIAAVAWHNKRDPLQDYLAQLPGWDQVPRLTTWLRDCAGVTEDDYHTFVSRMLIVSMLARAFDPGCLYRYVVVFQGLEEYRKSTFVAQMVPSPDWHDTITESFESKDMPMLIAGLWIAELSELDSLTRTEETRLKSFISKRSDSYVPKWGLFRVSQARRTIFIGTTNQSTWLRSSTGNTRWLPVKILHPMDVEYFITIREQLYAEAMCWYGDHTATWWEMPPAVQAQARLEREQRRQAQVYEDDLARWLETERFYCPRLREAEIKPVPHETSWAEIAIGYLGMDTRDKWKDMNAQKQIAQSLQSLGWEHMVTRREGKTARRWIEDVHPPF